MTILDYRMPIQMMGKENAVADRMLLPSSSKGDLELHNRRVKNKTSFSIDVTEYADDPMSLRMIEPKKNNLTPMIKSIESPSDGDARMTEDVISKSKTVILPPIDSHRIESGSDENVMYIASDPEIS